MMWLRPGAEVRVATMQSSVPSDSSRWFRMPYFRKWWANCPTFQYLSAPLKQKRKTNHEGAFYPLASVLRFSTLLKRRLSRAQFDDSDFFPEDLWLQTYMVNFEPSVPTQEASFISAGLCFIGRGFLPLEHARNMSSRRECTTRRDKAASVVPKEYVAAKRVRRNVSDPVVRYIMALAPHTCPHDSVRVHHSPAFSVSP